MKIKTGVRELHRALLGLSAAALLAASPAYGQVSTATIKGLVHQGDAPAGAATQLVAVNTASGYTYRTTTAADGSYVLTGLPPGVYQIQVAGQKSQPVTLTVGETASLDLSLGAALGSQQAGNVQQVVVRGSALRGDVKTSEVGTNVSRAQIENLPQVTRNFLAFADLAPGVRFDVDSAGYGKLQSGAQNQDNVNVFIDGVGQKNNILRGGVSGLDSTRGNPFPQSAVAEYKVITQNYKAEFDQVSSAAITAVTKSGTNEFHGDVFYDRTGSNWTAYDPFQKANEAAGVNRPSYTQAQYGATLGGPIIKDQAHFFIAYEGKKIDQPRQVVAQRQDLLPNAGIVPDLLKMAGSAVSRFKEDLVLGKVDAQLDDDNRLEFTARIRRESDRVPEDIKLSVAGNEKDRKNDETRFDLKHEWSHGDFRNEARIGYEMYQWKPQSLTNTPYIKYQVSPSNQAQNVVDVLFTGGSPDAQDRKQSGWTLQNDLTWTGLAGHTIKGGVKFKHLDFDLQGTPRSVDVLRELIDNKTGQTSVIQDDPALAPVGVNYGDNQIGLYLQDDWRVNNKLELNYGARWDYETNMLDNGYVTPADRIAIFGKQDPRDGAPAGQTYAQSLALGGVNIGDYFSNGSNRKPFKHAFQPRVGFSYDLNGDQQTVFFGGAGRAYDRTMANQALDEMQHNAAPNGEIWMIRSNMKQPYTDQFSLGVRQAVGIWNTEIGYIDSRSHDQFNWYGGNRDPKGGWGTQSPIDPLWGSVPPYGTLILGDFISQARTDSVYLKAEKPYSTASGWSVSATYTWSDAKTTDKEWTNDIFNWTYGRSTSGWWPSSDVEKHRLVVTGLSDRLLPWGIMTSAKLTYGSGQPYKITDCHVGWNDCTYVKGNGGVFRQVDFAMSKDVLVGFGKVGLRMDVLNLFNTINYGYYDGWGGGPSTPAQNWVGGDNSHLGVPGGVRGPMRTVKLTARYAF
jgi:hypothetical protein